MKKEVRNRLKKAQATLIGKPEKLILVEREGLYCDTQNGIEYTEEELDTLDQDIVIIRIVRVANWNERRAALYGY